MDCSSYITEFFESKGLTVVWTPEISDCFLFITKIKDAKGTIKSLGNTLHTLYEHYKDYYIHANHVQLMYYKSQYLSAFPLYLGTKYTHDKDITNFFVNKGLTVNWFPKFIPGTSFKPILVYSTDIMIDKICKYYNKKYTHIDLMYHIGRDGTTYLWFYFH